jgi:hypothetical protein
MKIINCNIISIVIIIIYIIGLIYIPIYISKNNIHICPDKTNNGYYNVTLIDVRKINHTCEMYYKMDNYWNI